MTQIWFLDTCTVINMTAVPELGATILAGLHGERIVALDVVIDELKNPAPEIITWAKQALADPPWTEVWQLDDHAKSEHVAYWQRAVADGRPVSHAMQHWAEAAILAVIEVLPMEYTASALLSDDYAPRIQVIHASTDGDDPPYARGLSTLRRLFDMVKNHQLTSDKAQELAASLHEVGRGPETTIEDFEHPTPKRLGRWGEPL